MTHLISAGLVHLMSTACMHLMPVDFVRLIEANRAHINERRRKLRADIKFCPDCASFLSSLFYGE